MNLYEIDQKMMEAFTAAVDPETGEIVDEEMKSAFDQLTIDRDQKIENICLFIKNLRAEAVALKAEKEAFAAREKASENKAESLLRYLKGYLNGEPFKTTRATVTWRKSKSVKIEDLSMISADYLSWPDPVPNKMKIRQVLAAGGLVPGAELVENQSMTVR
jgi:hypothetical protein